MKYRFKIIKKSLNESNVVVESQGAKKIDVNDVAGITLLSIEEARPVPQEILKYPSFWWLRSPGYGSYDAAYVSSGGFVIKHGDYAYINSIGVRPALHILNLDSSNLNNGDIIEVFDRKWYYREGKALLMDGPLTKMAFNANREKGNNYQTSDVKAYLDYWFAEQKEKYSK